jgi:hypothetical protein
MIKSGLYEIEYQLAMPQTHRPVINFMVFKAEGSKQLSDPALSQFNSDYMNLMYLIARVKSLAEPGYDVSRASFLLRKRMITSLT